jgi:hypothetical protein
VGRFVTKQQSNGKWMVLDTWGRQQTGGMHRTKVAADKKRVKLEAKHSANVKRLARQGKRMRRRV